MHLYGQSSINKLLLGLNSLNPKLISSHIIFKFFNTRFCSRCNGCLMRVSEHFFAPHTNIHLTRKLSCNYFMTGSHSCENQRLVLTLVLTCNGVNQFLLWELGWELGQELGDDLKTTQHCCASPWANLYRWKRGELWAKHMGQKCGANGNILGNTLGTWKTFWEEE